MTKEEKIRQDMDYAKKIRGIRNELKRTRSYIKDLEKELKKEEENLAVNQNTYLKPCAYKMKNFSDSLRSMSIIINEIEKKKSNSES